MAMQKVTCDPRREQRQQHDVADEHGDGREEDYHSDPRVGDDGHKFSDCGPVAHQAA